MVDGLLVAKKGNKCQILKLTENLIRNKLKFNRKLIEKGMDKDLGFAIKNIFLKLDILLRQRNIMPCSMNNVDYVLFVGKI